MMDTTTQSGQRPPNANRPTDAELARLLREFAELRDDMSDGLPSDWDDYTERVRGIAEALDTATARLTPAEWAEAVERAGDWLFNAGYLADAWRAADQTEADVCRMVGENTLRAAFPHLAPEDSSR